MWAAHFRERQAIGVDAATDEIYATATTDGMGWAIAPAKQGLFDSFVEQLVEVVQSEPAGSQPEEVRFGSAVSAGILHLRKHVLSVLHQLGIFPFATWLKNVAWQVRSGFNHQCALSKLFVVFGKLRLEAI